MVLVTRKKNKQATTLAQQFSQSSTWGDLTHHLIGKQFNHIVKQKSQVLADKDPEPLHQMRVGLRRLRSVLHSSTDVVNLPKVCRTKNLAKLGRILGKLRDLDVQLAVLRHDYRPRLNKAEQKQLDKVIKTLAKDRRKAFTDIESLLKSSRYQRYKQAYREWLQEPQYGYLAPLQLDLVLPNLLSRQLANLLLHSGWQISAEEVLGKKATRLHELRKTIKQTRYQAEFFASFYEEDFHNWLKQLRRLQDLLGQVQDMEILQDVLAENLAKKAQVPELQSMIDLTRHQALSSWEELRHQYLEPDFQQRLQQMVLKPSALSLVHSNNGNTNKAPQQTITPQDKSKTSAKLMSWEELLQDSGVAKVASIKAAITRAKKQKNWNQTFSLKGTNYRIEGNDEQAQFKRLN